MIKTEEVNIGLLHNRENDIVGVKFYCETIDGQAFDIIDNRVYEIDTLKQLGVTGIVPVTNVGPLLDEYGYNNENGCLNVRVLKSDIQNSDFGIENLNKAFTQKIKHLDSKQNLPINNQKVKQFVR